MSSRKSYSVIIIIILVYFILISPSCQKLDFNGVTKCNVEEVSYQGPTSVNVKIRIIDLSPSEHKDYGICYSKEKKTPSLSDSVISMGEINKVDVIIKTIKNLEIGSTYYFRAFVLDNDEPVYSFNVKEINTKPMPIPVSLEAKNITAVAAVLNGHVDPNNISTNVGFQYGITKELGQSVIAYPQTLKDNPSFVSIKITGLTPNTKYYYRVLSSCIYGTTYGDTLTFTTGFPCVPEALTNSAYEIKTTSAKVLGEITSDGGSEITERGICWSNVQNPTIADNKLIYGKGEGSFVGILDGLIPATTYYIKTYAINELGVGYGNETEFITQVQGLPTVTTMPVSILGQYNAICGGEVISGGDFPVTERGVCWNSNPNPTVLNNKSIDGTGEGIFYSSVSGLDPSNTYYIRAYATNSLGTSYGAEYTFKTNNSGGTWQKVTDHPRGGFYSINSFVIGNEIYFCNAVASKNTSYSQEIWKYNIASKIWTRLSDFPGIKRYYTTCFSLDGKGYMAFGTYESGGESRELWQYDPNYDSWSRKKDFPGSGRTFAFCFGLNGKAYLGGGQASNNVEFIDVYCYNPDYNSWQKKSDFPGGKVVSATAFVINNKAFVVGGLKANDEYNELWQFNENEDSWTSMAVFPGSETQCLNSFSINGIGIAGLGWILPANGATNQLYSYDYYSNQWTKISDFPGQVRMSHLAGSVNGLAYYGFGYNYIGNFSDLWIYTP